MLIKEDAHSTPFVVLTEDEETGYKNVLECFGLPGEIPHVPDGGRVVPATLRLISRLDENIRHLSDCPDRACEHCWMTFGIFDGVADLSQEVEGCDGMPLFSSPLQTLAD